MTSIPAKKSKAIKDILDQFIWSDSVQTENCMQVVAKMERLDYGKQHQVIVMVYGRAAPTDAQTYNNKLRNFLLFISSNQNKSS